MTNLKKNNHKGFTLIETLFAILIFSAALISLLTIAGRGISATNNVRKEITAHYLAQEGLEVVRNIRDSNFLATGGIWDSGFSTCLAGSPCNIVYATTSLQPCTVDPALNACVIAENNGEFVDSAGGTPSGYARKVYVTPTSSDEYLVTSIVSWDAKPIIRTVKLETVLKKWQ